MHVRFISSARHNRRCVADAITSSQALPYSGVREGCKNREASSALGARTDAGDSLPDNRPNEKAAGLPAAPVFTLPPMIVYRRMSSTSWSAAVMFATVDPRPLFSSTVMVVGDVSTGGSLASEMFTRTWNHHTNGRPSGVQHKQCIGAQVAHQWGWSATTAAEGTRVCTPQAPPPYYMHKTVVCGVGWVGTLSMTEGSGHVACAGIPGQAWART